jgi:ABC-type transporter Mla MlaB component
MNIARDHTSLRIKLDKDFNLYAVEQLKTKIEEDLTSLTIDLSACKLVDSEGIIFMHKWMERGNQLELIHPPQVLTTILEILELRDYGLWPQLIVEDVSKMEKS